MYPCLIVLTRILCLYSRGRMDVNNNLANLNLKVKCDLCEKSFFSEFLSKHIRVSSLDSHMLAHSIYKYLEFMENGHVKCLDCKRTFLRMDSAKEHYKDMHMADKNGNRFICKLCNEEFEVQYALKQHVKYIHGLQQMTKRNAEDLTCQICNKICRRKSNLDCHLRWHRSS